MKDLFYKPLKIKTDPKNVFVWSDLHLGHDKEFLWKPRGFTNVEQHDLAIKNLWQTTLNSESIIFILGDIMFGHKADERLVDFLEDVPFDKILLMSGNHHAGFKQLIHQSDDNGEYWMKDKIIQFIPNYIEAYINNKFWVMSHYPILSANGQGKDNFGGMIFGHCHGNLYKNESLKDILNGKIIDVGIENCPSPLSFYDLGKMFDKRENLTYDHHNNKTMSPV
jgi:calcineurin-like phosphoesterase family protein